VPFRHPDRSADLVTRIEFEVRERVEEAVDHVCLEALVQTRRARGLPPPSADSAVDKQAYTANVVEFLGYLERELTADLAPPLLTKVREASSGRGDTQARLVAAQVLLARSLPDYWQRFDVIRTRYMANVPLGDGGDETMRRHADASGPGAGAESGSEGRGLLARLFGRR
jgi:hypothetical protein